MATNKIEAAQWGAFLDDFTEQHQQKPVHVQVFGPGTASHDPSPALPLVGITLEEKGSEAGAIEILLGTETDNHVTHLIENPAQVWMVLDEGIQQEVLEIRDADGTAWMLRFAQ